MADIYFENEKTGKRYKVLEFDQVNAKVKLQGEHAVFTENFDKEQFKKLGYKLVQA